MIVGISTASLFPKNRTEDAIYTIRQLGAPVAEIFYSTFYEYRPEFSKILKERVGDLKINSFHTMSSNFEPNFFNPDKRVKGDAYYWLDQAARSAQMLGCKYYTFHGFHRLAFGGNDNFDGISADIGGIANFLADYNIGLCLENVHWCIYNRPGVFSQIKERVPNLKGVFDIKQARRSHFPWQMYINEMGESIAYAHFSDVDENGRMCLPGRGTYNFEEIIRRMMGVGFKGDIIIEVYGNDYSNVDELRVSREYLQEIIYKLS
jgi:sugar phosphate isomerase/epimerase